MVTLEFANSKIKSFDGKAMELEMQKSTINIYKQILNNKEAAKSQDEQTPVL